MFFKKLNETGKWQIKLHTEHLRRRELMMMPFQLVQRYTYTVFHPKQCLAYQLEIGLNNLRIATAYFTCVCDYYDYITSNWKETLKGLL